jgi:hypothetical protein
VFQKADKTTRRCVAAAVLVVAPLVTVAPSGQTATANAEGQEPDVTISASPQRLDLRLRPCIPTWLSIGFQNRSAEPAYATVTVRPDAPLLVSRQKVTTFVPTDYAPTMPVELFVPADTPPGEYEIALESGRERVSVPVVVSVEPDDPNRNLALGQETTASPTHNLLSPCGAVDGNYTYTLVGYHRQATAWADGTPAHWPDHLETRLAEPMQVGRVVVQTDAQQRFAIKDWDVQVLTSAGWQTVDQVRGHTFGRYTSSFTPVAASAVRINVLATNGYTHSIVIELEIYAE